MEDTTKIEDIIAHCKWEYDICLKASKDSALNALIGDTKDQQKNTEESKRWYTKAQVWQSVLVYIDNLKYK